MREGAKRRMVGAVVIVALAVIFVPMLFEDDSIAPPEGQTALPDEPAFGDAFDAGSAPPLPEPESPDAPLDAPAEGELLEMPSPMQVEAPPPNAPDGQPGQLGRVEPPIELDAPQEAAPVEPPPARSTSRPAPARQAATPPPPKPRPAPPPAEPRGDEVPSWVVQVASFGSSQSANDLAGKLKGAGFTAFVEQAEVRGKQFYRVRVGPEVDRDGAERTAARLRQQQKMDTLIQRYP